MRKLLTDAYCKALRPPAKGRTEVSDLRCAGLSYRVTAAGSRSWTFRFRHPTTRRTLRATIGAYPDISLSEARDKAGDLRGNVAAGIDPVEAKRNERDNAESRTFKTLADRYLIEHARRHKRPQSADADELNLNTHILPKWKARDYRSIRRGDVIELIEGIVSAGKHTAANRVHSLISKIFSFAVDSDLLDANPAARLKKRGTEKTGKRILSDDEIRLFWRGVVLSPISRQVGLALRLSLLTAGRANEIAGAQTAKLASLTDSRTAGWAIPAERVKNKRDFLVPLSSLAVETINSALELVPPAGAAYLFQSPRNGDKPIDRHSLAVAMARFAKSLDSAEPGARTWKSDPPSHHDLRRTVETRMSALGISKEDRDACLNHKRRDIGSVHYDMHEREKEKRAAFNRLAKEIARILAEKPTPRRG